MKQKSKQVTSLQEQRKKRNKQIRKVFLSPEERLGELEADMLRLIEFSLEQEEHINRQYKFTRQILDLLRRRIPQEPSSPVSSS